MGATYDTLPPRVKGVACETNKRVFVRMSFLSEIKRFDDASLKPVDTNLTTADGKKVAMPV